MNVLVWKIDELQSEVDPFFKRTLLLDQCLKHVHPLDRFFFEEISLIWAVEILSS